MNLKSVIRNLLNDATEKGENTIPLTPYYARRILNELHEEPLPPDPYRAWIGKWVKVYMAHHDNSGTWTSRLIAVTENYIVLKGYIINRNDVCYIEEVKK